MTDAFPVGLAMLFRGEGAVLHNVTAMSIADNKSSTVRQNSGQEVSK